MATVVLIGLVAQAVDRRIKRKDKLMKQKGTVIARLCVSHTVLFEIALAFENFLYCLLRLLFIASESSPLTMGAIWKSSLSAGNLICIVLLIVATVVMNRE